MNKEKMNQIIGDAYKSYRKEINRRLENWIDIQEGDIYEGTSLDDSGRIWTQEEFINKIKTDSEFSERWGLKIEEREVLEQVQQTNSILKGSTTLYPRKLITITYNNETIEIYE